jgi:hypothetical protein
MQFARARTRFIAVLSTALVVLPAAAQQQPASPVPAGVPATPDVFAIEQLDAMLAPIALYPDAVLAPMLMAASDPLPLVMAARWIGQPEHAKLSGDALVAALADQDWDPDLKALAAFPGVLRMLDANLDWTTQLGYAVANQLGAVLDSVQRLRRQAMVTGTLSGISQISVRRTGAFIAIDPDPANAPAVALPGYDPGAVYGPWPYRAPLPVRVSPEPADPAAPPMAFRDLVSIAWNRGEVVLNVKSWNAANGERPPISLSVWHPRPVFAVTGRVDVSLDAKPLPPGGPVGRPTRPSGIPANAIGRVIVSVPADLVRQPAVAAPRIAADAPHGGPPAAAEKAASAAPAAAAIRLAPLPAHIETVRANALSDVNAGVQASLFGTRGAESRDALAATQPHQDVAGLAQ